MSDTVIGVIVGGLIASIMPIISLIVNHKRWNLETKLEYFKGERKRLENLYSQTLERLNEAMRNNSYPSQMTSDILILMPKVVSDIFNDWMADPEQTHLKGKHTYMNIAVEMKKSLATIDAQIKELISN
jgi:hypothetical protein